MKHPCSVNACAPGACITHVGVIVRASATQSTARSPSRAKPMSQPSSSFFPSGAGTNTGSACGPETQLQSQVLPDTVSILVHPNGSLAGGQRGAARRAGWRAPTVAARIARPAVRAWG